MKFEMTHKVFTHHDPEYFTDDETTAPWWLCKRAPGSTAHMGWFWDDYIMKLAVGQSVDTDFRVIKRIE